MRRRPYLLHRRTVFLRQSALALALGHRHSYYYEYEYMYGRPDPHPHIVAVAPISLFFFPVVLPRLPTTRAMATSRKWTDGETRALIDAWRPLHRRRRDGIIDVWVPANQRKRARRTGDLVTADWREYRNANNLHPSQLRTHRHCQKKLVRLRLTNAALESYGQDEGGGGAAGGQARAGAAAAEIGVPVGAAMENASAGVAVEAEVEDGAAKEEEVGEANARRAPAGGFGATVPEVAAKLLDEALKAVPNDAAVVAKLSDMYREVAMKRIELHGQIVAALAASTVGAAVPEPDAARA